MRVLRLPSVLSTSSARNTVSGETASKEFAALFSRWSPEAMPLVWIAACWLLGLRFGLIVVLHIDKALGEYLRHSTTPPAIISVAISSLNTPLIKSIENALFVVVWVCLLIMCYRIVRLGRACEQVGDVIADE